MKDGPYTTTRPHVLLGLWKLYTYRRESLPERISGDVRARAWARHGLMPRKATRGKTNDAERKRSVTPGLRFLPSAAPVRVVP
jgi:hypothetical protein